MKIVMICEFFDENLEYQDNLLAKYYTKHGHQVTIITSTIASVFDYVRDQDRGTGTATTYQTEDCKIIRMPFRINILNRIKVFPSLMGIFEDEQPDLIFFHDIIPNIVEGARYVRGNAATKMIMDYHADYSNSARNWLSRTILHKLVRKFFLRLAEPQIERIFPVVPASADFLREVYGVRPDRMELLPLGTDIDFGETVRARGGGRQVREQLDIPDDAFVIFCGGKLNPLKCTEHMIDALRMIDDPKLRLLIVGTSEPAHAEYGAMLHARAEGDRRIIFRGWQDRPSVYEHLDAANVAIFPASQSVLWQQAIGMGLPVIVGEQSDIQPNRQDVGYLNLYDNLIVLAPQTPRAPEIARHIRALMADPDRLARMSDGARRTAAELLDWNKLIERTLRFNLPITSPAGR